jgi:4-carboxymuconolactone decarboxylase
MDVTRSHAVLWCGVMLVGSMLWAGPAAAQDRLPPIPADQLTAPQQQAVAAFRAARKAEPTGPFHPFLHSLEVMTRARALGDYLRYQTRLTPRHSEFVS